MHIHHYKLDKLKLVEKIRNKMFFLYGVSGPYLEIVATPLFRWNIFLASKFLQHQTLSLFNLGKSQFLTIQLLPKFVFDHRTSKLDIFDHPTLKTVTIDHQVVLKSGFNIFYL
jgi:hypothetical protein